MSVWFYIPAKIPHKGKSVRKFICRFWLFDSASVCENKISLDWFASLNNGLNLFYHGRLQHLEMTHPACNMYQLKPNSVLQPRMYISNEINYFFFSFSQPKSNLLKKKVNNITHLNELRYLPNSSHTKKNLGPAVKMPFDINAPLFLWVSVLLSMIPF